MHVADAHIDHLAGRSTEGVPRLAYWKQWHRGWSRLHLERKHRGTLSALARALMELPRLAFKCCAYRLIAGAAKAERYGGRLGGTWGFLVGREARRVGLGGD